MLKRIGSLRFKSGRKLRWLVVNGSQRENASSNDWHRVTTDNKHLVIVQHSRTRTLIKTYEWNLPQVEVARHHLDHYNN